MTAAFLVRGDARMMPLADGLQVDAIVTDPPAGIEFMGKTWDSPGVLGVSGGKAMPASTSSRNPSCRGCGGRKRAGPATKSCACPSPEWNDLEYRLSDRRAFISFITDVFRDCFNHLKPGGHAFVWALPRTSHWTATALEDAGFEIRDVVVHLFGSGFPKSLDVGKAIDKAAGAEREVVGTYKTPGGRDYTLEANGKAPRFNALYGVDSGTEPRIITAPATPEAAQWNGWGTALKPASEHWILCRKPLSEPTVAANVLAHSVGGLNVDGCRVDGAPSKSDGWRPASTGRTYADTSTTYSNGSGHGLASGEGTKAYNGDRHPAGRWPANVTLSHNDDCEQVGVKESKGGHWTHKRNGKVTYSGALGDGQDFGTRTETVPAWLCTDDCAVALLDAQSGTLTSGANPTRRGSPKFRNAYGEFLGQEACEAARGLDTGGASRFFYTAKASTSERNAGLPVGMVNSHPTVKPLALLDWLIRLITPPGGLVLDPFMGSGSVGCSAVRQGFRFIGIDQDESYVGIARRRITYWAAQGRQTDMFAEVGA